MPAPSSPSRHIGRTVCRAITTAVLVCAAACSHDAPRQNPLDPHLTPPVELTAALDDSAGTVALSWSRYTGDLPFAAYRVDRKVGGQERWETLDSLGHREQNTYLDTALTADTAFDYRIVVLTLSGHPSDPSNKESVAGFHTAPVTLLAAEPDSLRGAIDLRWLRYRHPDFGRYRVVRRSLGADQDTIIHTSSGAGDTVFTDAAALHEATYSYEIHVETGSTTLVSNPRQGSLVLPGVALQVVEPDARTASANLTWTGYRGPRFASYVVQGRVEQGAWHDLARPEDPATVQWRDETGLLGNTTYEYRVLVATNRGEVVQGTSAGGGFHMHEREWGVDAEPGSTLRLYRAPGDGVAVLINSGTVLRLVTYDASGSVLSDRELWRHPYTTVATAALAWPDGDPHPSALALSTVRRSARSQFTGPTTVASTGYAHLDGGGQPVVESVEAVAGLPEDPFAGGQTLTAGYRIILPANHLTSLANKIDAVQLFADGATILTDDFDDAAVSEGQWDALGALPQAGYLNATELPVAEKSGIEARESVGLRVSLSMEYSSLIRVELNLGSPDAISRARFQLDVENRRAMITAQRSLPFASSTVALPLPAFMPEAPTDLEVSIRGNQVTATIHYAYRELATPVTLTPTVSAGALGDIVVITDDRAVYVRATEAGFALHPVSSGASLGELRSWSTASSGRSQFLLGTCIPSEARVVTGRSSPSSLYGVGWPFGNLTSVSLTTVGTGLGSTPGALAMPTSLDRGMDGRFYVVDAANARVQVFGADGTYITQFGRAGSGSGEFDFGRGFSAADFAGSVAVGRDGAIYVAETGRLRIQKFAP